MKRQTLVTIAAFVIGVLVGIGVTVPFFTVSVRFDLPPASGDRH